MAAPTPKQVLQEQVPAISNATQVTGTTLLILPHLADRRMFCRTH